MRQMRMTDRGESLADIGWRIASLRQALGYSNAAQFANFVGWSPQQLSNYERGAKRPEIKMAIQLCNRTGVTLDWIYRGERAGIPLQLANIIQDYLTSQAA